MSSETIRFGIVGVCGDWGRGKRMARIIGRVPGCALEALCDIDLDGLRTANEELGVKHICANYRQTLDEVDLDVVFIATPMHLHAPQAIEALDRDIHVLSEVPATVDMEQSRELVQACARSNATYMMAENYIYYRPCHMVREMVRRGNFGVPYYAEGEYVHGVRWLHEKTAWRRKWQVGINGVTYGTHQLGPILQWMGGDRVESVSCAGSGHHYTDSAGTPYEMEDCCVMMCKMRSGSLVKIRNDLVSNGPGRTYYYLQGTEGVFDSDFRTSRIWLQSHCDKTSKELKDFESEFLTEITTVRFKF